MDMANQLTQLMELAVLWKERNCLPVLEGFLSTASALGCLRSDEFIVNTDVSSVVFGGVLPRVQEGQELVVAYWSSTLSKAARNYCVTPRNLLMAIV
jgi:hypothetical protein